MSEKTHENVNWIKRLILNKPVLSSILVLVAASLLTEIPLDATLRPRVGEPAAEFCKVTVGHTLTGVLLLGLLAWLGLLEMARFTPPRQWRAVWLVWPLAVMALLNFSSLLDGTLVVDTSRSGLIALFVLLNLSIGFCEEVMARGVVLSVLLRKWGHTRRGIYSAVLVSSALFGAAHIGNLVTGHLSLLANLTQIVYSVFFGTIFAACFLRNRAIWPVIAMHALVDLGGGLRHIAVGESAQAGAANNTIASALVGILITLPLFLYGLYILRKVEPLERLGDIESVVSQAGMASTAGR